MEEEDLPGRSARMGEELSKMLSGLEQHPNVGELRSKCLIVDRNADTAAGFDNSLTLAPPLSLTDEDPKFAAGVLVESITDPQIGKQKENRGQVS